MISPARVLERLNRLLPSGFFARAEMRRDIYNQAKGKPDEALAWMWHEGLLEVCLAELQPEIKKAYAARDFKALNLYSSLTTLIQWRLTRGLYEFDPELIEGFSESDLSNLPIELLRRMPEYAPYIVLRGTWQGQKLNGAWVNYCVPQRADKSPQLDVILHFGSDEVAKLTLDLTSTNLDECINDTLGNVASKLKNVEGRTQILLSDAKSDDIRLMALLLPYVFYLCAEEPDITGVVKKPQSVQKRRYKYMFTPPQTDNMLQVGFRLGGKIRMWRQNWENERQSHPSGLGLPKAPHIRKAHWHLYWTGTGRTIPRLKWIPALPVGVKDFDEIAVHVRPVLADPADAR